MLLALGAGAHIAAQGAAAPAIALRASIESAFDSVSQAGAGAGAEGGATRLRLSAGHLRSSRRGSLRLWGGVNTAQSLSVADARSIVTAATIDGGLTLSRRTRLDVAEHLTSSPLDLFNALGSSKTVDPSESITSGSQLRGGRTLTSNSRAAVTRTLSDKSVAVFVGSFERSSMRGDGVASGGGSARLTHRVGAFGGWHAGYGFTATAVSGRTLGPVEPLQQRHDLDAGVDFARPLPFLEHTTLSLSTGSSWLGQDAGGQLRFMTTVALEHRLTRRWTTHTDYSRPIQYVAGFSQPLLSDAVRLAIEGTLPARLALSVAAGVARGSVGGGARFESYAGSVRVTRRIGANWDLQADYHDARYRFDRPAAGSGIPNAFTRRGVNAGIAWAVRGAQ